MLIFIEVDLFREKSIFSLTAGYEGLACQKVPKNIV